MRWLGFRAIEFADADKKRASAAIQKNNPYGQQGGTPLPLFIIRELCYRYIFGVLVDRKIGKLVVWYAQTAHRSCLA